jgi:uncharacterized protein YfbU (UPF0304 family)
MRLTRTERVILGNQYRILELLDPQEAAHYRRAQEALRGGFETEYESVFERVATKESLSKDDCKYVIDTLRMFVALGDAYAALDDKTGINQDRLRFEGFDGHREGLQVRFAKYLAHEGPRFAEVQEGTDGADSHRCLFMLYCRMVDEWRKSANPNLLTRADVVRITSA